MEEKIQQMELDAKDKDDKHNDKTTQLKKDNDAMFGKVMMFLKKNGMTRFSLLSDEYYKDQVGFLCSSMEESG